MNLLILTDSDKIDNGKFLIDDHRSEHIINILKLKTGDKLEAGFLNGPIGTAQIETIEKKQIILHNIDFKSINKPIPSVSIICALPRPQILKKVLFVSGMMFVDNLYLIRSNRVEKSYFQSPLLNPEKMHKHLIEGMSQGKNSYMPNVSIHDKFRPFFEDFLPSQNLSSYTKLYGHLDTNQNIRSIYNNNNEKILIAIGPEGGWVDFEINTLSEYGFTPVNLGSWNLRVEYAMTAFLAQLHAVKN